MVSRIIACTGQLVKNLWDIKGRHSMLDLQRNFPLNNVIQDNSEVLLMPFN